MRGSYHRKTANIFQEESLSVSVLPKHSPNGADIFPILHMEIAKQYWNKSHVPMLGYMKPIRKEKHLTYFFEGEDAEDEVGTS